MCDYSAEGAKTRKAKVGDVLTTAKIGGGHTTGLVDPANTEVAVCCLPGTTMIFTGIPVETQQEFGIAGVVTATFDQRKLKRGHRDYHDGVRIEGARHKSLVGKDGILLLQQLPLGLEVTVESIPGQMADDAPATVLAREPELVNA
jgi:hypothetical protein